MARQHYPGTTILRGINSISGKLLPRYSMLLYFIHYNPETPQVRQIHDSDASSIELGYSNLFLQRKS